MSDAKNTRKDANNPNSANITDEDVRAIIDRAVGPETTIIAYKVLPYSEFRVGVLALHLNLDVSIQRNDASEEETQTFFIKCIPYDSVKETFFINETQVFVKESTFYRDILPKLTNDIVNDQWCPKCYLVKDDLIVLEDLRHRNFKMSDRTFDATTVESVLRSLASFHASSIVAQQRLGKSFYDMYPNIFKEHFCTLDGVYGNAFLAGIDVLIAVAKPLNLDTSNVRSYVTTLLETTKSKPITNGVICHGDLWTDNIMFDDSIPPKSVILDYQILRYLPQVADLAQFIYLTTNRALRDSSEKNFVEFYYDFFCERVRQNSRDIELPSLEKFLQDYENYRSYGLIFAALYYPFVLINSDVKTELLKDSAAYEEFFSQKRAELVIKLMEKDVFYKEMVIEITKETIEHSKKFK